MRATRDGFATEVLRVVTRQTGKPGYNIWDTDDLELDRVRSLGQCTDGSILQSIEGRTNLRR